LFVLLASKLLNPENPFFKLLLSHISIEKTTLNGKFSRTNAKYSKESISNNRMILAMCGYAQKHQVGLNATLLLIGKT